MAVSPSAGAPSARPAGVRTFERLGRMIVRHPWRPIIFWIGVFVLVLPWLGHLGSATNNSATNAPSSAPSSAAQAELKRLFPNLTTPTESVIVLAGEPGPWNATSAYAQSMVENVTARLVRDPSLEYVAGVSSLYTEYARYLAGQTVLASSLALGAINATHASAGLFWSPPAVFFSIWSELVNRTGPPAEQDNYLAYQAALARMNSTALENVLSAFYLGYDGNPGFNASGPANCANASFPVGAEACATTAARTNGLALVNASLVPPSIAPVARAVLLGLTVANGTNATAVQLLADREVASATEGLPPAWVASVLAEFPVRVPTSAEALAWATSVVQNRTVATEPIPIPPALRREYLSPSGTMTLIVVSYSIGSSATRPNGASPVYDDVVTINQIVPPVVRQSDPLDVYAVYQTGPAALDQNEQAVLSSSLAIVLPLTIAVLLLITMAYFRSPLTPLVTFAGIAIALVIGLGGLLLITALVGPVDSTSITLETTFVLGIGTDYSVFLVARYREELVHGARPTDAVVTSTTWAGQSVATSGSTAILATAALAFSGVTLLSQWGMVLSLAIFGTVALSLTFVPAVLALVGPRIFWPTTGARFDSFAARTRERLTGERTYFYRVGRLSQRRPRSLVVGLLLVSVPLVLVAVAVPLSYDFYHQLPSGSSATDGLTVLGQGFGPGFAFPSTALVTFASPLLSNGTVNATEWHDVANLTTALTNVGGIAVVTSPVGPYGAPLAAWLAYPTAPPAVRANLEAIATGSIGRDGRTVLFGLQTNASGLSLSAVNAVDEAASVVNAYAATHPEVVSSAFAGGAPVIRDLAAQTSAATVRLALAVSIGLFIVLLVVLRSWILPLLAVGTIGLSILWGWATTYLVLGVGGGIPLFFFVPTIVFLLILGLGIDYNIFLLTRVREERHRGRPSSDAAVEAVARTGGIITAAALILASAFAILIVGNFAILRVIGFAVAVTVILDAMVIRTVFVPSALQWLGDRVWSRRSRAP